MHTLNSQKKRNIAISFIGGAILIAVSMVWLVFGVFNKKSNHLAKNDDVLQIAFPNSNQYSKAIDLLQTQTTIPVVSLENISIPITDFSRVDMNSYADSLQRLIPADPRRTDFLNQLPEFFSKNVEGISWPAIYLPEGNLDQNLDTLKTIFQDQEITWTTNLQHAGAISLLWIPVFCFIGVLLLFCSRTQQTLFRFFILCAWLILPIAANSINSALLSITGIYATYLTLKIFPFTRNHDNKYRMRFFSPIVLLKHLWPYVIAALILILLQPILVLWISIVLFIVILGLKFADVLLQLDNAIHYHHIPIFITIQQTRFQHPGKPFVFLSFFTMIIMLTLFDSPKTIQQQSLPYSAENNILESSFFDYKSSFYKHLFVQNALTEGILSSIDISNLNYQVYSTSFIETVPQKITLIKKTYENSISELQQQISKLSTQCARSFPLASTNTENEAIKISAPQPSRPLDKYTYIISIMVMLSLLANGVISTIMHARMQIITEQAES